MNDIMENPKTSGLASAPVITTANVVTSKYPLIEENYVTIKHVYKTSILPEIGMINTAVEYSQRLGGAFKAGTGVPLGRSIFSDPEREKLIMVNIVGVSPNGFEWEKAINDYWHNISVVVPFDGKKLDCSVRKVSPDDEGTPINPTEWVIWKYALLHRDVANDVDMAGKSSKIRFYLLNAKEEVQRKAKSQAAMDAAFAARMRVITDIELTRNIITILGLIPANTAEEMNMQLAELSARIPERFVTLCADKAIQTKALIIRAILKGVLTQPANSTIIIFENVTIGHTLDEAVAWINDEKNITAKRVIEAGANQ